MIDWAEVINSGGIFRDKMIFALTGKGKQKMLDREKVIKGLKHCYFGGSGACYEKECPYYQSHDCTDELKNDILVLLKEQEAVEPKVSSTEQRCGNCNKVIEMDGWIACPWCGKPIAWNEWYNKNGGQAVKGE